MFPKLVQEIQGYKWRIISSGGVTLFASTYEPRDGDFTVSWGQSANCGELSQGEGSLKSYTKPTRIDGMDGLTILDIAAGQNSTFFVARPPPLSSAPAPEHTTVVPVSTVPATTPVVAGSTGVDLSGFGFDFAPPPVVVAVTSKATLPVKASGPSRTETAVWEALLRFPEIEEPAEGVEVDENCCICHLEGDDALECEKVRPLQNPSCGSSADEILSAKRRSMGRAWSPRWWGSQTGNGSVPGARQSLRFPRTTSRARSARRRLVRPSLSWSQLTMRSCCTQGEEEEARLIDSAALRINITIRRYPETDHSSHQPSRATGRFPSSPRLLLISLGTNFFLGFSTPSFPFAGSLFAILTTGTTATGLT